MTNQPGFSDEFGTAGPIGCWPVPLSHPKLSPAARREESPERLAHVTSDPGSFPAVGHTPRAAQPNGSVHVPHSMSLTAAAPSLVSFAVDHDSVY